MKLVVSERILRVNKSPLVRGRGLKRMVAGVRNLRYVVAPRAGAWIETHKKGRSLKLALGVAPRAGAWIETRYRCRLDRP